MLQTKVVEKIKTSILFSVTFFLNIAVYEIMWGKRVDPERPQMTIWPMRISRCVPKSTNTHSQYVILIAFALLQRLSERTSMLCYTYIAMLFCLAGIECRANCRFFISSVRTNKFDARLNIFDRNPQTPLSTPVY